MRELLIGLLLGFVLGAGAMYRPARAKLAKALESTRDVRRIMGAFKAPTDGHAILSDAKDARAEADAAYIPIYPGTRREPEPGWLNWIEELPHLPDYFAGRPKAGSRRPPKLKSVDTTHPDLLQDPTMVIRPIRSSIPPPEPVEPESVLSWTVGEYLLAGALAVALTVIELPDQLLTWLILAGETIVATGLSWAIWLELTTHRRPFRRA
jgi:hypothetical protein